MSSMMAPATFLSKTTTSTPWAGSVATESSSLFCRTANMASLLLQASQKTCSTVFQTSGSASWLGLGAVPLAARTTSDSVMSWSALLVMVKAESYSTTSEKRYRAGTSNTPVSSTSRNLFFARQLLTSEAKKRLKRNFQRPDLTTDRLFLSDFLHADRGRSCDDICTGTGNEGSDFDVCKRLVERSERSEDDDNPTVHYGLIASANTLMKDATTRDSLAETRGVLCFEMEAAGLMNHFPCLVIRGICDYSDTHKNKDWQGYAAMAAAAYAKDLLRRMAPQRVEAEKSLLQHMKSIDTKLDDVTVASQRTVTLMQDAQVERRHDQNLSWLSAPDPWTNYDKALRQRHPGSGQWLLENPAYSAWKARPNSFLWLHGIPGCGKTVLSSTVIEDLDRADASVKPVYFYFDFADINKQSLENAIRSLIRQLYLQRKDVQDRVNTLYAEHGHGTSSPKLEALNATFQSMIHQIGEVWIVLDALDECLSRNDYPTGGLLHWIGSLLGSHQSNVHLLVTSRPEQDIESFIREKARPQDIIHLQSDLVAGDIRAFVHGKVRGQTGLGRWSSRPDIQDKIEDALLEKADGMFRWVSCQLDALEKCLDPLSLNRALEKLPRTLEDTYTRILKEIPDEIRPSAIRILQFLTYSDVGLSVEEAVDVIAVDVEREPYFDLGNRMPIPEEIQAYCSSLVVLVKTEYYHARGPRLQLAHFSVKEYLTSSNQLAEHAAADFNEIAARASIAKVNLSYLLGIGDEVHAVQHGLSEAHAAILQAFPLADYAANHWAENTKISASHSSTLRSLLRDFFSTKSCYTSAFWISHEWLSCNDALHYASEIGATSVIKALLYNGANINSVGDCERSTTLHHALHDGHFEVLEMLLDHGADVNIRSPLLAATRIGNPRIVQLLLNHGADPNACDEFSSSALHTAALEGHMEIFQMLLDHGASTQVAKSLLYYVASSGCLEIVLKLLEQGADANAEMYGIPLVAASSNGHLAVVKILVNFGADLFAREKDGRRHTPLSAASSRGHREIVRFLLKCGAQDSNALIEAAYSGRVEISQMLLDHGVDVDANEHTFRRCLSVDISVFPPRTALSAASSQDFDQVVEMLLSHGAQDTAALATASMIGHISIIQMLLDGGANINGPPSPLWAAASSGNIQVVEMLLDNGAEVNGSEIHRPLHACVSRRLDDGLYENLDDHVHILKILLARGADVDAQDRFHKTALEEACLRSNRAAVQILLDNGAHCSRILGTAVHAAASSGDVELVELLLKHGAEKDATLGFPGETALQLAAARGDLNLIQVLLDHDVDTHVRGQFCGYSSWGSLGDYGDAYEVALHFGNESAAQMIFNHGWFASGQAYRCCGDHDKESGASAQQFTSDDYRSMFSFDHLLPYDPWAPNPLFTKMMEEMMEESRNQALEEDPFIATRQQRWCGGAINLTRVESEDSGIAQSGVWWRGVGWDC
ncbi:ankyrin repeat-containing domain protein [Phyllosticta capitalensis]|uniref:Ankyrin repeat-containing domain protein n=1 Tax=Phyllosticta capitalensis TaxID=121624 RepID=A0ABR1YHB6_9PEZI